MTQLDRAFARREIGSVRWSLILGTAMAAILIGGLLIVTSPKPVPESMVTQTVTSPKPVPESIVIRTDREHGTFIAVGDAVDSGTICPEGVLFDQRPDSPPRPPDGVLLESRLVCPDGGADFRIRGEEVEGVWHVVRGSTGTDLEGEGRFYTFRNWGEEVVTALYTGEMALTP